MLVPSIRHTLRIAYHFAQNGDFVIHRLPVAVRKFGSTHREFSDELIALFGDDLDGVGRKELIIAKRRRDRAGFFVVFKSGLHIVAAVAAGFEAIDAHNLVPGEPGRQRRPGISALKLAFTVR